MLNRISMPVRILGVVFILLAVLTLSKLFSAPQGPILTGAKYVSAGGGFTCAITTLGGAKCWGMNNHGQVGDGTTTARATPTDVLRLYSGITAISTGIDHACALTEAGAVKCWGNNQSGQLGDGTIVNRPVPVDVVGLDSGISAIAVGDNLSCAITTSGEVKCWGDNTYGQVGDGTTQARHTPTDVRLDEPIQSIAINFMRVCALTTSGGVICWGEIGPSELLSENSNAAHNGPVEIMYANVKAISAGGTYSCALTEAGVIRCWGHFWGGECYSEDQTPIDCARTWQINSLFKKVNAFSIGRVHQCFLLEDGLLKCVGNNGSGQLGDGTTTDRDLPVYTIGIYNGVQVSVGDSHTCALTAAGEVKCWGYNSYGRLGDGTNKNRSQP